MLFSKCIHLCIPFLATMLCKDNTNSHVNFALTAQTAYASYPQSPGSAAMWTGNFQYEPQQIWDRFWIFAIQRDGLLLHPNMQHGCHSAETYNGSAKFPKVKNRVLYMFPVSDARPTCTKHATDGATASKLRKRWEAGTGTLLLEMVLQTYKQTIIIVDWPSLLTKCCLWLHNALTWQTFDLTTQVKLAPKFVANPLQRRRRTTTTPIVTLQPRVPLRRPGSRRFRKRNEGKMKAERPNVRRFSQQLSICPWLCTAKHVLTWINVWNLLRASMGRMWRKRFPRKCSQVQVNMQKLIIPFLWPAGNWACTGLVINT